MADNHIPDQALIESIQCQLECSLPGAMTLFTHLYYPRFAGYPIIIPWVGRNVWPEVLTSYKSDLSMFDTANFLPPAGLEPTTPGLPD